MGVPVFSVTGMFYVDLVVIFRGFNQIRNTACSTFEFVIVVNLRILGGDPSVVANLKQPADINPSIPWGRRVVGETYYKLTQTPTSVQK